jgi:hypothetical protein
VTALGRARHSLIRAAITEYRYAKLHAACWVKRRTVGCADKAWRSLARAADLREQARAVGEAMRVLRESAAMLAQADDIITDMPSSPPAPATGG